MNVIDKTRSPRGANWKTRAGRLAALGAVVIFLAGAVRGDSTAATQPANDGVLRIAIQIPTPAGAKWPAAVALCGAPASVLVTARANSRAGWVLAYGKNVLARGPMKLDADGRGKVSFALPDVRHRAECRLIVMDGKAAADRKIILLPKMLSPSRDELHKLGIGVIDPTGHVQAALAAEGIKAENLQTDLSQAAFAGGLVIISGFKANDELAVVCRRLTERVKKGLNVLILNPPVGFSAWGFKHAKLSKSVKGGIRLAKGFGVVIRPRDMGSGPWQSFIRFKNGRPLVWFQTPAPATQSRPSKDRPPRCTVVAGTNGLKGRVVIAVMPQLRSPDKDAVGRCLLNETTLWILSKHIEQGKGKKK